MRRIASLMLIAVLVSSVAYGAVLTASRNTPERAGKQMELGVAAGTTIFAGGMVAIDTAVGFATNAGQVAGLRVIGRAEETVDNSGGTNAQLTIKVESGVFGWVGAGDITDDTEMGQLVYVVDDQTVSTTNGAQNIIVGRMLDYDGTYAWVETGRDSVGDILPLSNPANFFAIRDTTQLVYIAGSVTNVIDADTGN